MATKTKNGPSLIIMFIIMLAVGAFFFRGSSYGPFALPGFNDDPTPRIDNEPSNDDVSVVFTAAWDVFDDRYGKADTVIKIRNRRTSMSNSAFSPSECKNNTEHREVACSKRFTVKRGSSLMLTVSTKSGTGSPSCSITSASDIISLVPKNIGYVGVVCSGVAR